ncbi:MAG: hypothetical protein LBQ44_07590 [Treponema sp.]|nr:hypothetical protein [Treponema sp.]
MAIRKDPRYSSNAQVFIAEVPDTEAVIKNLSVGGLCVKSSAFIDVVLNRIYKIDVVPEASSSLKKFTVNAKSRWIRAQAARSESGFVIVIPPGNPGKALFDQYLKYLETHAEAAEES